MKDILAVVVGFLLLGLAGACVYGCQFVPVHDTSNPDPRMVGYGISTVVLGGVGLAAIGKGIGISIQ